MMTDRYMLLKRLITWILRLIFFFQFAVITPDLFFFEAIRTAEDNDFYSNYGGYIHRVFDQVSSIVQSFLGS